MCLILCLSGSCGGQRWFALVLQWPMADFDGVQLVFILFGGVLLWF